MYFFGLCIKILKKTLTNWTHNFFGPLVNNFAECKISTLKIYIVLLIAVYTFHLVVHVLERFGSNLYKTIRRIYFKNKIYAFPFSLCYYFIRKMS